MSGNSKTLIAFNYFGGKFTFVDYLYEYFPEHTHFIDVFCGSMAVTLNKPFSQIDTANDINSEVVNFFKVLRTQPTELIAQLELTPVSREEYNNSWYKEQLSDLEKARRFYVRTRQSFYGLGSQRQNKGWHCTKTISRANRSETVSKWNHSLEKLEPLIEKLRNIQIENRDFRELIPKLDFEGAFFYCDPPYPEACRSSKNDYRYDFTDQDHQELASLLHQCKGKVMISSYDCQLMRDLYPHWRMEEFPIKKNNIRSTAVQECIWMNYDLHKKDYQVALNFSKRESRDK